jgi:hypothetical protein
MAGAGGLLANLGIIAAPPIVVPPSGIMEPPPRLRERFPDLEIEIATGQSQSAAGRMQQDSQFSARSAEGILGVDADAQLAILFSAAQRQMHGHTKSSGRIAMTARLSADQRTSVSSSELGLRADCYVKSGGEAPITPEYHGEPEFFQPLDPE